MGKGKAVHVNGLHANKTPSVDRVRVFFTQRPDTADLMKTCGRSPQRDRQVLDLAQGTVTCSFGTVNLRERRLTSLEGFPFFEGMHTLFLQDNFLSSFDHLGTQPGVKELTLDRNCIYDFLGAERLPKLRSLSLEQNPVADWDLFPVMACLAFNPQLLKVNGKVISKQQRQLVQQLDRPVTRIALRQGWILSASPQQEAEVDIPVEEFFFRLDSFVDQLLAQGVPAHLCEINVHHHLKRSYEMLADVRVSATPASPPCSAGPASLHSSRASLSRAVLFEDTPGSASILSRPKWRPTGSRLAGEEAAEARERRRHEREAYNRWARHLDLLPPPAAPHQPAPEPAAPSAPAQSAPPPPLDAGADAGGRGAGRDEAAGLHGVIHPRSLEEPEEPEDEHYPDRPARRAAPGSPAEAAAPGVRGAAAGPELPWRLAGQRDPVRALAQQPPAWGAVPPSRPATAGAARASPPPGGGGHPTAPSPGQAVAARGARAQRSPEPEPDHGGRARPSLSPPAARAGGGGVRLDSSGPLLSSSRSPPPGALRFSPDWLDSVLDSGLGGAPGTVPGRAGGEVGVGSRLPDDEDIAAMLEDIKEAARSSGAREEWSPSPLPPEALREDAARAAHGPMQRLLLAAPDARPPPPAPPPHAAAPALAADSSAVRAARPPPAACGGARGPSTPPGPPPLAAKAPVPRRQASPPSPSLPY
jgi:hypothetical protein